VTEASRPRLLALVAHARDVRAADREEFAARLGLGSADGSVAFVTCHRVERYSAPASDDEAERLRELLPVGGRALADDDAARHLLEVAVGRDSVVLGEDQILHQLRAALETSRRAGPLDPAIHRLFSLALHAGRRARSWQQGRRTSLGDVAVDVIEQAHGDLRGRPILVVGAGKMGALAARAAARAGANVIVANRSAERGRTLADAIGGRATALDPGDEIATAIGAIVATSGPWAIGPSTAAALVGSEAIVVDLSFPAAVSASLARDLGPRLVTADRLATDPLVDDRRGEAAHARVDALVEGAIDDFREWLAAGTARDAAAALVRRADDACATELDALWRRVPALGPEARSAIEAMTRHLATRLLQPPLERLGQDRDGRDASAIRDLFAL